MKKIVEDFINIEDEFFNLDHYNKIAYMKLKYDKPSDIINSNCITKTPILNNEFIEWIRDAFESAPNGYKIDLIIEFNDFENYSNQELQKIFKNNCLFEIKKNRIKAQSKSRIAYSLILIGVLFFIGMILLNSLWDNCGVVKDIFVYIADIATTVTIWEALTILIVENRERKGYLRNLFNKFTSIEFKLRNE